jgi:hypothetical protein
LNLLLEMCGCNKKPTPSYAPAAGPVASTRAIIPALPTVDTAIWGPPLWSALHRAAHFGSDDRFSSNWSSVFSAMNSGLPCPDCTAHYNAWFLSQFPPPPPQARSMYRPMAMMMRGRRGVQTQAVTPPPVPVPAQTRLLNLHNDINQRTGKPVWDLQQVIDTYGGDKTSQVAVAVAALQSLQGVIGAGLYDTLMALLQTL